MKKRLYERSTRRILWYRNDENCLKGITEKRKTAEFRKRVSAKTAVFSDFKSVKRVKQKRRHLDRAPQARARMAKVSYNALLLKKSL